MADPLQSVFGARRTLKNNHIYLVDNEHGAIPHQNQEGLGLYKLDTRFLSCLQLTLNETLPIPLLSSSDQGDGSTLVYTNASFETCDEQGQPVAVPRETLQLQRESLLNGGLLERFTLVNYHTTPLRVRIALTLAADFCDIFEVRQMNASVRGVAAAPVMNLEERHLTFSYIDVTGETLSTKVSFPDWMPQLLTDSPESPVTLVYEALLSPLEPTTWSLGVHMEGPHTSQPEAQLVSFAEEKPPALKLWEGGATVFESDNADFNEMLDRSHQDIRMLTTQYGEDTYIAAGIPWYTCLFGRDSLIAARDCLILNPALAESTLKVLAKHQGQRYDPARDEAPGKILHELRMGELARSGSIPHTPYYGSVDATALWIMLYYDTYRWTGNQPLLESLWSNALAGMDWIDEQLQSNPLGYLTYRCEAPGGLHHQGWKDSNNSAMYGDGALADPPIALAEVQGYVYLAKKRLIDLADRMGHSELRKRLKQENLALKARFNKDFWVPHLDFCALGLDAQGRPLPVVSSNPGHCLETGIFSGRNAKRVARRLLEPDMFNGWGIRTLSAQTPAYNPMSYHNGSIWPHDNAMIARGLAAMEQGEAVDTVFTGLFEAARQLAYRRLPELFCGFDRKPGHSDPPVRYPVACSPQAWAASSVFALTLSMLNLCPDLDNQVLSIRRPRLPHWINHLRVRELKVGRAVLDLEFKRTRQTVMVDVHERRGRLNLRVEI